MIRVPLFAYACHGTPVGLGDIGRAVFLPLALALAAGVVTWGVDAYLLAGAAAPLVLLGDAVVYSAVYLAGLLLPPWRTQFLEVARMLLGRSRPGGTADDPAEPGQPS